MQGKHAYRTATMYCSSFVIKFINLVPCLISKKQNKEVFEMVLAFLEQT